MFITVEVHNKENNKQHDILKSLSISVFFVHIKLAWGFITDSYKLTERVNISSSLIFCRSTTTVFSNKLHNIMKISHFFIKYNEEHINLRSQE